MSIACPSVFVKLEPVSSRELTIAAIESYHRSLALRDQCARLIVATGNKSFVKWDDYSDESAAVCRDLLLKAILAWSPTYRSTDALYTRHENRGVRYKGTVYLAVYQSRAFDLKPGETDRRGSKCMRLRAVKAKTLKAMSRIDAVIVDLDAEVN